MRTPEPGSDPSAIDVAVDEDELTIALADGRRLSVPLAWFPRLLRAGPTQRMNWRLVVGGQGIHWPDVDEDVSVEGLLRGASAFDASRRAL